MEYSEVAALINEKKIDEAGAALKELRILHPDDVNTHIVTASYYEVTGDSNAEFEALSEGMRIDPVNYEIFYMLGLYYEKINTNQAFLCMEQALFYCEKQGTKEECELISLKLSEYEREAGFSLNKFSVLILSYNDRDIMIKNINSFRENVPSSSYEFIVVDNNSDDGIAEWLKKQSDIILIENDENAGFPEGCNIGVRRCDREKDLLIINNDAVPAVNAVFWLRMGLYEGRNVGAVSAVSNNASTQNVEGFDIDGSSSFEECMKAAADICIPMKNPYEERFRFTGFAVLLKKEAYNNLLLEDGGIFDNGFSPAYFEDDDLGIRTAASGYRQYLCHNSFIYHKGGEGFDIKNEKKNASKQERIQKNRQKFIDKWGFDIWGYEASYDEMIALIEKERSFPLRFLEIDCGMGINLSKIKYLYPYSYTAGIELSRTACAYGRFMGDIICGDPCAVTFPWIEESFDYIFAGDRLKNIKNQMLFLKKLKTYLKPDGIIFFVNSLDGDINTQKDLLEKNGFRNVEVRDEFITAVKE